MEEAWDRGLGPDVMLPKCGHAVTMDRPRKCAQVLRNFIGRHTVTMETTAQ